MIVGGLTKVIFTIYLLDGEIKWIAGEHVPQGAKRIYFESKDGGHYFGRVRRGLTGKKGEFLLARARARFQCSLTKSKPLLNENDIRLLGKMSKADDEFNPIHLIVIGIPPSAVHEGWAHVIRRLIEEGADPNKLHNSMTPLDYLIEEESLADDNTFVAVLRGNKGVTSAELQVAV